MNEKNTGLAGQLAHLLGDAVTLKFITHGYHWNVMGSDFAEFHEFFGNIYEDVDGSIDPLAENLLKLGFDAPYFLSDFTELTCLNGAPRITDGSSAAMLQSFLELNTSISKCLRTAFGEANASNEQGIANFLAERIDMHHKWEWQTKAFLGVR